MTARDLLEINKKGDMSDTLSVVKDGSGRVRWLETNTGENVGWDAILRKHDSDIIEQYPDINSREDIKRVIYRGIKNSDEEYVTTESNPGGGTQYILDIESRSDKPLRVAVSDNGFILNAFPDG